MRHVMPTTGSEQGVSAQAFRPSAERFGSATGSIVECRRCGHGFVDQMPSSVQVSAAYAEAADPVSVREEEGQIETARRDLARIEEHFRPGLVCDLGCWTGSFLVAAAERGWRTHGVEPSAWASTRARSRHMDVCTAELNDHDLPAGAHRLVVMTDVLEHLADPRAALARVRTLLEPSGGLWLTVPDAGSVLARAMGRRWWSVLPMHLQYFSVSSMTRLLDEMGFDVMWQGTHAKVFSARYYAERLGGYSTTLDRVAVGAVKLAGQSDRLVAPDFRDRLAMLTRMRPASHNGPKAPL